MRLVLIVLVRDLALILTCNQTGLNPVGVGGVCIPIPKVALADSGNHWAISGSGAGGGSVMDAFLTSKVCIEQAVRAGCD